MDTIYRKRVNDLLVVGSSHAQGSDKWFQMRHSMITASDVCTALGENPYATERSLLIEKCTPIQNKDCGTGTGTSNTHTSWGTYFEPIAQSLFCTRNSEKIHQTGCIRHKWDPYIGASPDGILSSGVLLEIKCPVTRAITTTIPTMYWIQMQIQMEVCRLETCVFLQCKFHKYRDYDEYRTHHNIPETDPLPTEDVIHETHGYMLEHDWYWRLDVYQEQVVQRDTGWYRRTRTKLRDFWLKVLYYRNHGVDSIPEQYPTLTRESNWVSCRSITHFLMNDVFMDIVGCKVPTSLLPETFRDIGTRKDPVSTFVSATIENNNTFLNSIVSVLKNKVSVTSVWTPYGFYSYHERCDYYKSTMDAMDKGYDVIHNAVLHNKQNSTYGVADLLVRSDKLTSLFSKDCGNCGNEEGNQEALSPSPQTQGSMDHRMGYYYVVVSIKDVKLPLTCDGVHVLNTPLTRVVKGVTYLLTQALGEMQGYTPTRGFLVGSRWSYTYRTEVFRGNSCFENIGEIDFNGKDVDVTDYSRSGVLWIRGLQQNKIDNTMKYRMYPNMCCSNDYPYHSLKKSFSEKHGEITSVWCCNETNRLNAMERNIFSWRDPSCTIDALGITGEYYRTRVKAILDINRQSEDIIRRVGTTGSSTKTDKISSIGVRSGDGVPDYYIDFETTTLHSRNVTDHNIETTNITLVAMIGCGWVDANGVWRFQSFVVDTLTMDGERDMVQRFYDMIESHIHHYDGANTNTRAHSRSRSPTFVHWGHAEHSILCDVLERHPNNNWYMLGLFDLCSYFKKNIIVIRGSLTFGLKDVTKAMYKNGVIDCMWDQKSECVSGMDAMVQLLTIHQEVTKKGQLFSEHDLIHSIQAYNEMDCRVLYDIISYYQREFPTVTLTP